MTEQKQVGYYTGEVTLQDVLDAKPTTIYYGANTCWWSHRDEDLYEHPRCGLPCDPRGGMLMQTDDADGFLKSAQDNADHYGKHGLKTFMAAHHSNMVVSKEDRKPTCFKTWDEYNAVLDQGKK